MLWIQRLWIKLQTLFRSERTGQSLDDELQFHLEQQIAENVAAGMSKEEARYAAMRLFGNHTMVAENARETWGWIWLEQAGQDLRYAFRSLRKSPLFTAVAILTLALGIGATTSIFTLFYDVLLKSLTVANPGELYRLGKEARCCYWGGYSQENEYSLVSYDLYKHFRDHTQGFAELAAFQASDPLFGVQRSGGTESAQSYPGEFVSGNYFAMFGISAYAGRLLTSTDDQPGAPAVAVMSYRLWQQYGSDPSIVGSVFHIDIQIHIIKRT